MTWEHLRKLRELLRKAAESLEDEDALEAIELFPVWVIDKDYSVGDRVRFNDVLYRCVQAHRSQQSWAPDETPALWTVVSLDEWPEWIQPTGAHDAYSEGAKVTHKDGVGGVGGVVVDKFCVFHSSGPLVNWFAPEQEKSELLTRS